MTLPSNRCPALWLGDEGEEVKEVKIGVLVIGPLYWDDSETGREWRSDRLDWDWQKKIRVAKGIDERQN